MLVALTLLAASGIAGALLISVIPQLCREVIYALRAAGLAAALWSFTWLLTILAASTLFFSLGIAEAAWLSGMSGLERGARMIAGWGLLVAPVTFLACMHLTRHAHVPAAPTGHPETGQTGAEADDHAQAGDRR
jgi:hypothetical protein